jgi:hypothetical protein
MKNSLFVAADIVVMGRNPEMADITNPHGDIHGFSAYVVIEDNAGNRWAHNEKFVNRWEDEAKGKAEILLLSIQVHVKRGGSVRLEYWTEIDPAYGSEAYAAQGTEQKRAQLEREEEFY